MPLAEGATFAGYTIRRLLGTGGMGEVYLADHPRLPRQDALKVLGTAVSADDEYRQRFNLEAEMVATLRHPNIVTIYDRGEDDGQLWIAMEFVDGTDAGRLLTDRYPAGVPPSELVRIVAAVAEALDFAHSRQVLHRDIKPANILLGAPTAGHEPGPVMLADFGVARWIDKPNNLTGVDMTVGTVNYAAPEQLKGEHIDGRADQYALAATAYHLLTGTAPFAHTNPAVVISHHLSADPPPLKPDLSGFGPAFARALAKDPADRFPTCRDFAAALRDGLIPAGGARHAKPDGSSRRRWALAGTAALVLAGAAAGAALLLHRGEGADSARTTPPPPAVAGRMDLPVVVTGADCAVLGAAAVTETGQPAYCARTDPQSTDTVWSLQPPQLRPR